MILAITRAQLLDPCGAAYRYRGQPLPSGAPTAAAERWARPSLGPANPLPGSGTVQ